MADWGQGTGDRGQETGDGGRETGDKRPDWVRPACQRKSKQSFSELSYPRRTQQKGRWVQDHAPQHPADLSLGFYELIEVCALDIAVAMGGKEPMFDLVVFAVGVRE